VRTIRFFWAVVFILTAEFAASAQRITGDWQGTIGEGRKFRVILKVEASNNGGFRADLYSIDQSSTAIPVRSLNVNGSDVTFEAPIIRGAFKGMLSADGNSLTGAWTQPNGGFVLNFVRATKETAWALDQSPHKVSFVQVDSEIKLEVLDWGGSGRPLVLLAGLGNDAHVFDVFAPKLKTNYHVYGITRRGFGASATPAPTETNYSANRLGDDIVAVLDALKLAHPVLVGHSIAGEELSSIGTRHPQRVAGLVYLDAGYHYAAYDKTPQDIGMDRLALLRKLTAANDAVSPQEERELLKAIAAELPAFEKDVKTRLQELTTSPDMTAEAIVEERKRRQTREGLSARAIQEGKLAFGDVRCPALAIFAVPHQRGDQQDADADLKDIARVEPLIKAFERAVPGARIVRLPHANHYVFNSNQAEVIREIDGFVGTLKD